MVRPTVARIDLAALTANYRQLVGSLAREGNASGAAPGVIAVVHETSRTEQSHSS